MKPAKYETSAGALAAFLATRPQAAGKHDLYTIAFVGSRNGGQPLLFTTCDSDILVPYTAGAPLIPGGPFASGPTLYSSKNTYFDQLTNKAYGHWKVGLDTDTWQVIVSPAPNATIGGVPFLQAVAGKVLQGATISVDRAIFNLAGGPMSPVGPNSPLGVVNVFTGRVYNVNVTRTNVVITINSHVELLGIKMPRNLYQAGCRWTLFDAGCTLIASSFAVAGSMLANSVGNTMLSAIAAPGGSKTYTLGRIVMTSGLNTGFSRGVRSWVPGTFTLISPFPFVMGVGDTFMAYPGCDKQLNTCNLFANTKNFGGQPNIPIPETAV